MEANENEIELLTQLARKALFASACLSYEARWIEEGGQTKRLAWTATVQGYADNRMTFSGPSLSFVHSLLRGAILDKAAARCATIQNEASRQVSPIRALIDTLEAQDDPA